MLGYFAIMCMAVGLLWLDPQQWPTFPGMSRPAPEHPVLRRTPRPPINEALLAMEDGSNDEGGSACMPDAYTVHVFSKAPLVLYLENFLSTAERQHLVDISRPLYEASTVTHDGGKSILRDATVRDSEVAMVPRTAIVRCIEARARSLQGWRDDLWIERLRVQRYGAPSGHYGYHFDWSRSGAASGGWGRVSSLMVFVDDGQLDNAEESGSPSLVGGGTAFPRLPRRSVDGRWCQFIACPNDNGMGAETPDDSDDSNEAEDTIRKENSGQNNSTGVVFKPVVGNAVFWENFRPDGTGRAYNETWHAGMRVRAGVKIGLNIWSWGRVD